MGLRHNFDDPSEIWELESGEGAATSKAVPAKVKPAAAPRPKLDATHERFGHDLQMINRRVRVYWEDDGMWYSGKVREFDVVDGSHLVLYDDGELKRRALSI